MVDHAGIPVRRGGQFHAIRMHNSRDDDGSSIPHRFDVWMHTETSSEDVG
jgi:hypothetical protein